MADAFLLLIGSVTVRHRVRLATGPLHLPRDSPHCCARIVDTIRLEFGRLTPRNSAEMQRITARGAFAERPRRPCSCPYAAPSLLPQVVHWHALIVLR